jgi:hypothetical protein
LSSRFNFETRFLLKRCGFVARLFLKLFGFEERLANILVSKQDFSFKIFGFEARLLFKHFEILVSKEDFVQDKASKQDFVTIFWFRK